MAYKRYAKKNGKIYGPYYYESYREDGKVKKIYIGQKPPLSSVVPRFKLLSFAIIFVALAVLISLVLFVKPTGKVALQTEPNYELNGFLSGQATITLQEGDSIQKDTQISLVLLKDNVVLAETTKTLQEFLGNQIDYVPVTNDSISCVNITIPSEQEVCENVTSPETTEEVCHDEQIENETIQVCENVTTPGEISLVCTNQTSETTEENCTTTTITDYYYQTPGSYSVDLHELLDYSLTEPGDYVLRFSIPNLGVESESSFSVSAPEEPVLPEENETNQTVPLVSSEGNVSAQAACSGNLISSCCNIGSTGTWNLSASILGSASTCITIGAANVVLDCKGYTIDGTDAVGIYGINDSDGYDGTVIKNCNITDFWYGIYFFGVSGGRITNNTVSSNTRYGVYLYNSSNNNLTNNIANSNTETGIFLDDSLSRYNMLINNTASGPGQKKGIVVYYATSNTLVNNTANSNSDFAGIMIQHSSNSTLINNIANSNSGDGVYVTYSNYNNLIGNTFNSNFCGILLSSSSNNSLTNNTAQNNNILEGDFSSFSSLGNFVTNLNTTAGNLISFTSKDIALKGLTSAQSSASPSGYGNIDKYLNIKNNAADSWLFLNISYSDADVPAGLNESTLRIWKRNATAWTNETFYTAGKWGVDTTTNIVYANITNFGSTFVPLGQSLITSCPYIINTPGYWFLSNNLTTSTTGITINASNVTLDCQGFTITYGTGGGDYAWGINATHSARQALTNVVIKNCVLRDTSSGGVYGYGIRLYNATGALVQNNTIRTNGTTACSGISLYYGANNSIISNNIFALGSDSGNYGIHLYQSSNNNLTSNTITTKGTYANRGVYLNYNCNYNTLTNNIVTTGISENNHGIEIDASSSNTLTNNTISTNGTYNNNGIYLISSSNLNNFISNNIITTTNTSHGIFIAGGSNNYFVANRVNVTHPTSFDWRTEFFSPYTPTNNTAINLTLVRNNVTISLTDFNGANIKAMTTAEAPADTSGYKNITKYLNITNNTAASWIYLNVSYNNATDIPVGVVESTLKMYKYNTTSTNWQLANTSSSVNGVDLVNKVVYANITEFGSIFAPLGESYQISSCPYTISNPGYYNLTQNINSSGTCITIGASNVVLDCQGYTINGTRTTDSYGINNTVGVNNITVKNCVVKNFYTGIYFRNVNSSTITNNNADNNTYTGIYLRFGSNNTLVNNSATNNTWYGFLIWSIFNSTLANNTANLNSHCGIDLEYSNYNTLINNNGTNNTGDGGIRLSSSSNNTLTNNIANSNSLGIRILMSSNNNLTNNIFSSNAEGIFIDSSSNYNTLTNNTANSNSQYGIEVYSGSNNNTLTNNTAQNNSLWDFHSSYTSLDNLVTNLNVTAGNLVSFTSKDIALKGLATAGMPANPSGYSNISKYLNITNNSATSWIYLNVSYNNATDISEDVDESTLKIYRYNTTDWILANTSSADNGVDIVNKVVYANITEFGSIFAPLGAKSAVVGLLNCTVNQTACDAGYTDVLHMSNYTNAHAEMYNETDYADDYLICCKDELNVVTIGTNDTGTSFLRLSNYTDAHVELPNLLNYNYPAYISASSGGISCAYSTSCIGNQTCLATISGDTDAHIASCAADKEPYNKKICCELTQNIISSCPYNITTSDIYILNQSLTSEGDCISVNADEAILDCAAKSITGNGSGIGVNVSGFNSTTIRNCIITNFSTGILLADNSFGILRDNRINANYYGVQLSASNDNEIISNTFGSNVFYGINIDVGSNNTIATNNASGNELADFYSQGGGLDNIITNLTTQQNLISFTSKDIALKGLTTAGVPSNPTGYKNITKYINATNNSATSWIYLNVSYSNVIDVPADVVESMLKIYRYNSTAWVLANTTSSDNGVDIVNKVVYANITDFGSTFAPLGPISLPNVTLIYPPNATIINESYINFTINATAQAGLANATLTIYNETGLYNQTTFIFTGSPIQYTLGIVVWLADGIYNWFWEVIDLMNNIVNTGVQEGGNRTLEIDVTAPNVTIFFPEASAYNYHNQTLNFSVSDANLDSCWKSLNNGANVTINCNQNTTVNSSSEGTIEGVNNISVYANDTLENIGFAFVEFNIGTTAPSIFLNTPLENQYLNSSLVNFTFHVVDSHGISTCELYGNWTGTWALNQSITGIVNDTDNSLLVNISDGYYDWNIRCNDSLNNYAFHENNHSFTVDTINPSINIVTPIAITYNNRTQLVNISATDLNLDIVWFFNGTVNVSYATPVLVTFEEGPNILYAYANDSAGNLNSTYVTFAIDTIYPTVQVTYPENITYNINVSELNYTFSDANPDTCWYSVDEGANNATITCGENASALTSNEGSNIWIVWINDSIGNENSSSVTFFKDTIYPLVEIVYPANATYNINVSELNYTFYDLNSQACWYSLNEGTNNLSIACGDNITGSTSLEGSNIWTVWANDSAGNENYSSVTFFKDTVIPNATIIYPPNGTITNESYVNFTINLSDQGGLGNATLYIYNETGDLYNQTTIDLGGVFQTTLGIVVWLADGVYNWFWEVIDLVGNLVNTGIQEGENRTVTTDTIIPLISIESPQNVTYNTNVSELNYTFLDANPDTCWYSLDVGATSTTIACGDNITGSTSLEGSNIWTVWANDSAGNENYSSVTFFKDTVYPLITIESPQNITYNNDTILVNLTITELNLDSVWFFNGTGNETYTVPVYRLFNEGSNTLDAYVNDSAGNFNWTEVTFFVDITAPAYDNLSVSPDSPADYIPGQNYSFNATWTDNLGVESVLIEFNGTNYPSANLGGGIYNFNISDLGVGNYSYRWSANDSAGNANQTGLLYYLVNKASSNLIINMTPSNFENRGTQTSVSGLGCPSQLSCTLYRNGVSVTNPDVATLNDGTYNYTYNTTGNENYTRATVSAILTIVVSTPPCEDVWSCSSWSSCTNEQQTRDCTSNCGGTKTETQSCCAEISVTCEAWSVCTGDEQTRECVSNCNTRTTESQDCVLCTPEWKCTGFGICTNGLLTRTCTDLNNCGSEVGRPEEVKECGAEKGKEGCSANYSCGEWSECVYDTDASKIIQGVIVEKGFKESVCSDANDCAGDYTDRSSCTSEVQIETEKEDVCNTNTLTLFEKTSKTPITSIDLKSWNANKLDIAFTQQKVEYCPDCYNGIKDGDEKGVDCGGSCRPCKSESKLPESSTPISASLIVISLLVLIPILKFFFEDYVIVNNIHALIKSGEAALKAGNREKAESEFRKMKWKYIQIEGKGKKAVILKVINKYHGKIKKFTGF